MVRKLLCIFFLLIGSHQADAQVFGLDAGFLHHRDRNEIIEHGDELKKDRYGITLNANFMSPDVPFPLLGIGRMGVKLLMPSVSNTTLNVNRYQGTTLVPVEVKLSSFEFDMQMGFEIKQPSELLFICGYIGVGYYIEKRRYTIENFDKTTMEFPYGSYNPIEGDNVFQFNRSAITMQFGLGIYYDLGKVRIFADASGVVPYGFYRDDLFVSISLTTGVFIPIIWF
jgi:hypothetical protein